MKNGLRFHNWLCLWIFLSLSLVKAHAVSALTVFGGTADGPNVSADVSEDKVGVRFSLAAEEGYGSVFITVSVPTMSSVAGIEFARPGDEKVSETISEGKSFLQPFIASGIIVGKDTRDYYYDTGSLGPNDPDTDVFIVGGLSGLAGHTLVLKSYYYSTPDMDTWINKIDLTPEDLHVIQEIRLRIFPGEEPGPDNGTTLPISFDGYGEVVDPVSGFTFVFPEGGNGTLTTSRTLYAPGSPVASGEGFYFDYSGNEPVQFKIPRTEGETTHVYAYGEAYGCLDGGTEGKIRWMPVPETESEQGYLVFDFPASESNAATMRSNPVGSSVATTRQSGIQYKNYWVNQIKPGDGNAEKERLITLQIRENIDAWIDELSEPLKSEARNQVDNHFGVKIYEDSDGTAYVGFGRSMLRGIYFSPFFTFRDFDTVEAKTIAHEVGHYMTHVLARSMYGNQTGDQMYLTIENLAPPSGHGQGDVRAPRQTVTEEPAFFSQYFLMGDVDGSDPSDILWIKPSDGPASIDYPSIEGFGCTLLTSLMRSSGSVRDWESRSADVPSVGASFGGIFGIIAKGANNIDTLKTHIDSYLTGVGKTDTLSVIAERLGWSYHGKGRLTTPDTNLPVADAQIQAFMRVDGVEYTTPDMATTDGNGEFSLPRLFPGCAYLRISKGERELELPTCISWERPTTEEIQLGNLFLADDVQPPEVSIVRPADQGIVGTEYTFTTEDKNFPSGADAYYSWSFGDGATATSREVQHAYSEAGSYTVEVKVLLIGSFGKDITLTNQITFEVKEEDTPPTKVSLKGLSYAPAELTAGMEAVFWVETENEPANPSYAWDFGEAFFQGTPQAWTDSGECKWTYNEAGTYTITISIRDKNNYGTILDKQSWQVTVVAPPPEE